MFKIAVFDPIHQQSLAMLSAQAELVLWDDPAITNLEDIDGLIVRQAHITRDMIAHAPKLKVIGNHGVGVDIIDVAAAREYNVPIVYVPLGNVNSVAELFFAQLLAVCRWLVPGMDTIRAGNATAGAANQRGLELYGKELGIIGYGHIGARVAEIGKRGFGMNIHAYSRSLTTVNAPVGLVVHDNVGDLLAASDFICLSLPLTTATKGLIGAKELARCRKNAVLVNCARGGIVDEQALVEALASGHLFGAACDVFLQEPPRPDNPLFQQARFLGSQHIGANTEEALMRVGNTVAQDVLAVLHGKEPRFPYKGRLD